MKDFIVMIILMFLVNFLPMVYGRGVVPTNPWWVLGGYAIIAFLYAVGSYASREREKDKLKLTGETNGKQ